MGLSRDASADDVKTAYRKLALKWHPDRNPGNAKQAEDEFKQVSNAYSILSDPDRRRHFDIHGADNQWGRDGAGGGMQREAPMTPEEARRVFKEMFGDRPIEEIAAEMEKRLEEELLEQDRKRELVGSAAKQLERELTDLVLQLGSTTNLAKRKQLQRLIQQKEALRGQTQQQHDVMFAQNWSQRIMAKNALNQLRSMSPEMQRRRAQEDSLRRIAMWGAGVGSVLGGSSILYALCVGMATSFTMRLIFILVRKLQGRPNS